jgi:hypothetical protein
MRIHLSCAGTADGANGWAIAKWNVCVQYIESVKKIKRRNRFHHLLGSQRFKRCKDLVDQPFLLGTPLTKWIERGRTTDSYTFAISLARNRPLTHTHLQSRWQVKRLRAISNPRLGQRGWRLVLRDLTSVQTEPAMDDHVIMNLEGPSQTYLYLYLYLYRCNYIYIYIYIYIYRRNDRSWMRIHLSRGLA